MADALMPALDGMAPPMIGKPLAVLALGAEAVALPRFAQLAPGAAIARTASFMMHRTHPLSSSAIGKPADGSIRELFQNPHPVPRTFHTKPSAACITLHSYI